MNTLEQSVAVLKNKTPDQIAELMVEAHIKGRTGTTGRCPLATLFNGMSPGRFLIGQKLIIRHSGSTVEKLKTPKNLADFVRKFDIGGYPELIAPAPRCLRDHEPKPQTKKQIRPKGRKSGKHKTYRLRANHFAIDVGRFPEKG